MNFINIAGHLGSDAEVRFTSSGKKVTTLRVATRTRKGQNEDTIWWRVTIWGEQYDKLIPYLKKGSSIVVFGEFHKPEIFNDREGKPQVSLEITAAHIQFSPFGKGGNQSQTQENQQTTPSSSFGISNTVSASNPYMSGGKVPGAPAGFPGNNTQDQGETFDDEVPF